MAPREDRRCPAASHVPAGGASSRASSSTGVPHEATWRRASVRSCVAIPGADCAGLRATSTESMTRTAIPGPVRAARPARCSRRASAAGTVTSEERPRPASKRGSRASPASTTTDTPGTVSEDSAMDVERMTRRSAAGESARSCSAALSCPCSVRTGMSPRRRFPRTVSISPTPGRNTRTEPSVEATVSSTVRATCARYSRRTPTRSFPIAPTASMPRGGGA